MIIRLAALLASVAAPAPAQGVLDRFHALSASPPTMGEIYADEAAADRALIARHAAALFDPARPGHGPEEAPVAIVLFTGPDCAECASAEAELAALAGRLSVRATVIDTARDSQGAALMATLGLDLLPSYVTPSAMIRGAMPIIVLESDLKSGSNP